MLDFFALDKEKIIQSIYTNFLITNRIRGCLKNQTPSLLL